MLLLVFVTSCITFACLEQVRAAGCTRKSPNWPIVESHYDAYDVHNWENLSPYEKLQKPNPYENSFLDDHDFNPFEDLGDPEGLGPLNDLSQDDKLHQGIESSNDLLRDLSLDNGNRAIQSARGPVRYFEPSSGAPEALDSFVEDYDDQGQNSSSGFCALDSSHESSWYDIAKACEPFQTSEELLRSKPKSDKRRKRHAPLWRIGLAGHWTTIQQNYLREMNCGYPRARTEIDGVADLKLTEQLLSDDLEKRRWAASTISTLFNIMYPYGIDNENLLKEHQRSYAKQRLGKNLGLAIKAVAKQLRKAPRTAESIIKRYLTSNIIEMLNDQNSFQAGIDMICCAHVESILNLQKGRRRKI